MARRRNGEKPGKIPKALLKSAGAQPLEANDRQAQGAPADTSLAPVAWPRLCDLQCAPLMGREGDCSGVMSTILPVFVAELVSRSQATSARCQWLRLVCVCNSLCMRFSGASSLVPFKLTPLMPRAILKSRLGQHAHSCTPGQGRILHNHLAGALPLLHMQQSSSALCAHQEQPRAGLMSCLTSLRSCPAQPPARHLVRSSAGGHKSMPTRMGCHTQAMMTEAHMVPSVPHTTAARCCLCERPPGGSCLLQLRATVS